MLTGGIAGGKADPAGIVVQVGLGEAQNCFDGRAGDLIARRVDGDAGDDRVERWVAGLADDIGTASDGVVEVDVSAGGEIRRELHAQKPAFAARVDDAAEIEIRRCLKRPVLAQSDEAALLNDEEPIVVVGLGGKQRGTQIAFEQLSAELGTGVAGHGRKGCKNGGGETMGFTGTVHRFLRK